MITENRIYIADLAEYNNGNLVGKWIDLPSDDIMAEVRSALSAGNEEWAITDYELPFSVGEYEDIYAINSKIEALESLDETEMKKLAYLDYMGEDFYTAIELISDVELYENMTFEDLAYELVDEGCYGDIPANLVNYLDYSKIARDLEYDYYSFGGDLFGRNP